MSGRTIEDYVKDMNVKAPWPESERDPDYPEEVTEIVFDRLPDPEDLRNAVNRAIDAAFRSSGTLRIRGVKAHC